MAHVCGVTAVQDWLGFLLRSLAVCAAAVSVQRMTLRKSMTWSLLLFKIVYTSEVADEFLERGIL